MRLYFNLSPNTEMVPYDYQHFLIGAFHKWIGINDVHDRVSLYSLSWMSNGKRYVNGLMFPEGAKWFISCYDGGLARKVLKGAIEKPEVCCGMKVTEVMIMENPCFKNQHRFLVSTPVLIRKFDGKELKHLTYHDAESNNLLTQTMKTKLKTAGISNDNVLVQFDRTYPKARTKLVTINGIHNRASVCPVIINGTPEVISFAWDVGVGHSTGSGFGALC